MTVDDQTNSAEQRIAAVLAELEIATGSLVRRVEIFDLEVTRLTDTRRQMLRSVRIDLQPIPGTRWSV